MMANTLKANICCPRCGFTGMVEIEAPLDGHGAAEDYSVGDTVQYIPD
jgi:hypothetical protein